MLGEEATVAALAAALTQKPQVVHLATHGSVREAVPAMSSVLLVEGDLTASDLTRYRFDGAFRLRHWPRGFHPGWASRWARKSATFSWRTALYSLALAGRRYDDMRHDAGVLQTTR